jgi:hypothetical protein
MTGSSFNLGASVANGITGTVVGFMATLCDLFRVSPEGFKRPGARPNAPPPSGGMSSIG